ncbi:MAG: XrtA system polysaccharide deacetylase [Rhodospirillaceae bacterium]
MPGVFDHSHTGGTVVNAMSVDVEDYFHVSAFTDYAGRDGWDSFPMRVVDNTRRILDLFAAAEVQATFFVLGWVAERYPQIVRAIVEGGHELASHGYDHIRVGEQRPEEFRADVTRTRLLLEAEGGVPVRGYRAASFSINRSNWWAFDELAEAGYLYSSSVSPIHHDHYGVPDAPRQPFQPTPDGVLEIPVGTIAVCGRRMSLGGGFFRALPYRWSRGSLAVTNAVERRPEVFYFHPWEIDPGQPRLPMPSMRSRVRHYLNLGVMEGKVRRLLDDFHWNRIDRVFPVGESNRHA